MRTGAFLGAQRRSLLSFGRTAVCWTSTSANIYAPHPFVHQLLRTWRIPALETAFECALVRLNKCPWELIHSTPIQHAHRGPCLPQARARASRSIGPYQTLKLRNSKVNILPSNSKDGTETDLSLEYATMDQDKSPNGTCLHWFLFSIPFSPLPLLDLRASRWAP